MGMEIDGRFWTLEELAAVVRASKAWWEFSEPECEGGLRGECNKGWHNEEGERYVTLGKLLGTWKEASTSDD